MLLELIKVVTDSSASQIDATHQSEFADGFGKFIPATASRSFGYHTALAVALALAPLAVEPHDEHSFVTQFLASWGSAHATTQRTGRRSAEKDRVKQSLGACHFGFSSSM